MGWGHYDEAAARKFSLMQLRNQVHELEDCFILSDFYVKLKPSECIQ